MLLVSTSIRSYAYGKRSLDQIVTNSVLKHERVVAAILMSDWHKFTNSVIQSFVVGPLCSTDRRGWASLLVYLSRLSPSPAFSTLVLLRACQRRH